MVDGITGICDFLNYTCPVSQTGGVGEGKESAPSLPVPCLCSTTTVVSDQALLGAAMPSPTSVSRGSPVPPAAPGVCLFCGATGTLAGCLDVHFKLTKARGKNKVNVFVYVFFLQGIVT